MIRIKTEKDIQSMRISGKMLAQILKLMREQAVAGLTPKELAMMAATELKKLGGTPSFLGYGGNPPFLALAAIRPSRT
jgi:methionyl aminopeptidase